MFRYLIELQTDFFQLITPSISNEKGRHHLTCWWCLDLFVRELPWQDMADTLLFSKTTISCFVLNGEPEEAQSLIHARPLLSILFSQRPELFQKGAVNV